MQFYDVIFSCNETFIKETTFVLKIKMKTTNFCFCLSNRSGAIFIGFLQIAVYSILIAYYIVTVFDSDSKSPFIKRDEPEEPKSADFESVLPNFFYHRINNNEYTQIGILGLIHSAVGLISAILMLNGIHGKVSWLISQWVVVNVIQIIFVSNIVGVAATAILEVWTMRDTMEILGLVMQVLFYGEASFDFSLD